MRAHILMYLFLGCPIAFAQNTTLPDFIPIEQFRAFEKHTTERLMKAASSDFAVACINLTRDVQEKRLTVYSVASSAKSRTTNEAGFKIQVIYHRSMAENYEENLGSYQRHYNSCLLDFALAQHAEGNTALSLRLIRLLAEAEPLLSWSSMRIESINIKRMLTSLEADDGSIADIIQEALRDWRQRERDYKP